MSTTKNRFTKYLDKDSVLVLKGGNKREVLDELIRVAAERSHLSYDTIKELTWKREKMMTTGVGGGLALPHIRLEVLPNPVVICGICEKSISDYGTQDGQPVRVIMYIMAPARNQEAYLELLGSVSSRLKDEELLKEIIDNITRPSQVLRILKSRKKGEDDDGEESEE